MKKLSKEVELMMKIRDNKEELSKIYDLKGDKILSDQYYWEAEAMNRCIRILTNPDDYELYNKIYESY